MSQISFARATERRLKIMLAGGIAANSPLHVVNIFFEVANLLALLASGAGLLSRRGNRGLQSSLEAGRGGVRHSKQAHPSLGLAARFD